MYNSHSTITVVTQIQLLKKGNADGIKTYNWFDSKELVFQGIKSNTTWVKLLPEKYIYKADDSCNAKEKFYDCYIEALNESSHDCADKCLPYHFTEEENSLPFCDNKEFECGMEKAKSVLEDVLNEDYDKHTKSTRRCKRNCTIIQYKETSAWQGDYILANKNFTMPPRFRAFIFQIPHKKMIVREEYHITNVIDLIAYSGGVLGIFIGFSFPVVVHFIIQKCLVWNADTKDNT